MNQEQIKKGVTQAFQLAFKSQLEQRFPFVLEPLPSGRVVRRPVLLAISGGMDSMVLGHLLQVTDVPVIWVHCNFHLRGEESNRDAAFVRARAAQMNVPLIVKEFETQQEAARLKMSIEETARKLRYDFFQELIDQKKEAWGEVNIPHPVPQFVLTAHHAGDQIETLLLNFFRGCGISGLHGIPAKNKTVLRPLLAFNRAQLLDYALHIGMDWVEDSTNQSVAYSRNYLRNKIIPELQTVYPAIEQTLLDNIQRFSQAEVLYLSGLEKYKKRLMNFRQGHLHLSVRLLQKSGIAQTLLWEALKAYGFGYRQISETEKLLVAHTGAYQDSATKEYRILRNRAHLVVSTLRKEDAGIILIEEGMQEIAFPAGRLEISSQEGNAGKIPADPAVAMIDCKKLSFPLLLRKWRPGDYFYPLGLGKKKKIARFLIDQKIGMHEKQDIWVVLDREGRIIWIPGQRIDDRFKVTPGTKNILKLKLLPTNDLPK